MQFHVLYAHRNSALSRRPWTLPLINDADSEENKHWQVLRKSFIACDNDFDEDSKIARLDHKRLVLGPEREYQPSPGKSKSEKQDGPVSSRLRTLKK